MLKKVLVANRGEIALRVIRALKEMDIKSVAVYSEADRNSLHVKLADESYCIGSAPASESYLNVANIIQTALASKADAIHPGYGFLAENTRFVEICESHGLKFIGPPARVIKLMGEKSTARKQVKKVGVPVIPGTEIVENEQDALDFAKTCQFPIMLKANGGGGGKGLRVAYSAEELLSLYRLAKLEAQSFFGDDKIYLEKYLPNIRHVEMQIAADGFGNYVHLGERDCSVQRRYQKLIEESPCAVVDEKLRARMGEAAINAARAVGYENLGTVEFLLDEEHGDFYFIEMNTRIQVEHPVTEMVTGFDLVKEQILIASGNPLSFRQKDVILHGHAIECRINAEDPAKNFAPSCGTINFVHFPGGYGIRVDSHIYNGLPILPFYDNLLAKIIGWGTTRAQAMARIRRALDECRIEGIYTNIDLLKRILNNAFFMNGKLSTSFIEKQIQLNPMAEQVPAEV